MRSTAFDLTPLNRFTVGFDNMNRLLDSVSRFDQNTPSYPPYNIEKVSDDGYRVTMAVAGFTEDQLDITVTENTLVVTGSQETSEEETNASYLHRGIAARAFKRQFQLAEHIKVQDAALAHGLLTIDLVREVPEEKQPKQIAIKAAPAALPGRKAA